MSDTVLKLSGLEKTYRGKEHAGEVHALRGIDLLVRKGEFITLHGPSGCGKSTLLLTAGALLRPDRGEVLIDGLNPYQIDSSARAVFRARHVGFVFQRFHLVPYLTVLDNITVPGLVTGKTYRERAQEVMNRFGLSHRTDHYPSELSVGEQQRVALARAVCAGTPLLLADEPTGNLDTENGKAVLAFMADFAQQGGAVLMVTHEQAAGEYATRSIGMQDGQLLEGSDQ